MHSFNIVDLLVRVYDRKMAHLATTKGTSVYPLERIIDEGAHPRSSKDGRDAADRYSQIGFRMGRSRYRLDRLDPAAERVHELVSRRPKLIQRLIIENASDGRIPRVPPPRVVVVRECKAKPSCCPGGRPDPDAVKSERAFRGCYLNCPLRTIELSEGYPHAEETARTWWEAVQDIESHFLKPGNALPGVRLMPMGDLVPEKYRRKR